MTALRINSVRYSLTPDGRLANLAAWNEDVAQALAEKEHIELTDEHWEILCVMRLFYQEYNISPVRKLLRRSVAERLGPDKGSDAHLEHLFPNGVEIQATRIAGIPTPLLDAELESFPQANDAFSMSYENQHFISEFQFEGKTIRIYAHGNLVDPTEWSEPLAEFMAARDGLHLSAEHWEVLRFLRKFYFEFGISPMVRLLMKHMEEQFGAEKSSEEYLYTLFPAGPSRQGSRIAGLPEPQGCIDP